ncbi:hypothetical protein NIES4073_02620 (plasmid) [Kalymmatonema gypsitolerans NIES-4073]|nr:hypothetical protein NIES4073_02620 [Scytonema sp. NIES-4073]
MKIKWLVETLSVVTIREGEAIQPLFGETYDVPDDSEYFLNALTRGWAERIEEPQSKTTKKRAQVTEE